MSTSLPAAGFPAAAAGVAGFIAAFGALGGHVHRAATADDVEEALAVAAAGRSPVVRGAVDIGAAAAAAVGVVPAVAAIASTGTLVLDGPTAGCRSVSLLPPVCVFVVDAAAIVDTPSQVLRDRTRWWPDGPPSQLLLVTGPSRSADIEMSLTVGVHGPGEVHAVIVGGGFE